MPTSRIILTGGTGTLGSALVEELVREGYECVILTRTPERHNSTESVKYMQWIADADYLSQIISGSFAVINLAGSSIGGKRWTKKYKQELLDSRIAVTAVLVAAINKSSVKPTKLISSSATGYYGDRGDEPLTETSEAGSTFLADLCLQWETAAKAVSKDVDLIILRTGVVLTVAGGAYAKILFPFKLFLGGRIADGEQYFSWIHIADWKRFLIFALQNEAGSQIYNLTSPVAVTNEVLTKTIGKVYHRPTLFRVPKFTLKLILGEMSSLLLESQRAIPQNIEKTKYMYKYSLLEDAIKSLKNFQK
jgi:uncharacterized protein (TIGR01777 family)